MCVCGGGLGKLEGAEVEGGERRGMCEREKDNPRIYCWLVSRSQEEERGQKD